MALWPGPLSECMTPYFLSGSAASWHLELQLFKCRFGKSRCIAPEKSCLQRILQRAAKRCKSSPALRRLYLVLPGHTHLPCIPCVAWRSLSTGPAVKSCCVQNAAYVLNPLTQPAKLWHAALDGCRSYITLRIRR